MHLLTKTLECLMSTWNAADPTPDMSPTEKCNLLWKEKATCSCISTLVTSTLADHQIDCETSCKCRTRDGVLLSNSK